MVLEVLSRAEQVVCSPDRYVRVAAAPSSIFYAIKKQSMNLVVRFVADRVNLWTELLPRGFRILIEQGVNPVVVLLKQKTDLSLLCRSQYPISHSHVTPSTNEDGVSTR
jgi:hypothetical protein